uniref:Secreted protein n=1 Tax=Achlya hypogyna TaxID=1202772 RepID=A0A0A7CNB3_ACHHY|nr:secreted protein [Achlya hypogyna]
MTLGRAVAGLLTIASVAVSQDIVAMALTPPPVPRMYSPSNANISVYLGNNISVADFVETKTVLLNLLADMMGVARTAVHVAYLDTPVFDRLTRGRLTVDLTVDLTVPWVCSDSRVVAATLHLPASFTSLDATTACNDLAVSVIAAPPVTHACGLVLRQRMHGGPSVWNPTAQVQRITQGLTAGYTFKTMDGSSRWLTLQDVNGYFGLFPHSIESFTLEAPTSPALFSSTYLAARVVLAGAVDGTDAIEVAFALAATLRSSALAVQAENFRSFPLEAVPAAVYGRSDAWLLDVTIAEASTVRRTSIASVLQTGKWQALLPTTKVLAYDVNSDASQPVAQAAAKSYPAASLVVTLGCPLSLMQLTSNMTTFVAGISAALPNWLVLETY